MTGQTGDLEILRGELAELVERHGLSRGLQSTLDAVVATAFATGDDEAGAHGVTSTVGLPERFEDRGRIAVGAMGEVRRVFDTHLERPLAMKLIRPEIALNPTIRLRFLREARVTARLQHPGIVSVHDHGELEDGRLWFTMKEVRGETLAEVIARLHGPDEHRDGWTLRKLADAFVRICQAVAYAHSEGVIHRDLKPMNIMVGAFGEVMVMDWGIARRREELEAFSDEEVEALPDELTRHGQVLGTPAYMAPEQARGEIENVREPADIYALGGVLFTILQGVPPGHLAARDFELDFEPPAELVEACERAMSEAPHDRHPTAEALAADVRAWIEGTQRRERAAAVLEQLDAEVPEVQALREEAAVLRRTASDLAEGLKSHDPVEDKAPAWELEDRAEALELEAERLQMRHVAMLQTALQHDPENAEARRRLADHHLQELREAERSGSRLAEAAAEMALEAVATPAHRAFLLGDGHVTLVTDPPGARVQAQRYLVEQRRYVLGPAQVLGTTPLREVKLPRGRYLLTIEAEGCEPVRYPIHLRRAEHWDGVPPGGSEPEPVRLPRVGELGEDEIFVPRGWFLAGGDPEAVEGLPPTKLWCHDFIIQRYPVTNAQFLEFINDLVRQGGSAEADRHVPKKDQAIVGEVTVEPAFDRRPDGTFTLGTAGEEVLWRPDWPVTQVDWHGARAFAQWLSERTGHAYRLPASLEWEKAARGVDGRPFPWGEFCEPTWANMLGARESQPGRVAVGVHPLDCSPYGVRDLAGNVRDWCLDAYRREGPHTVGRRVDVVEPAVDDDGHRMVKGGAWGSVRSYCRLAGRFGDRPMRRLAQVGFRLVRTLTVLG